MLDKVISGGQTGVDRIGLLVAEKLLIPTGGTAPKGYRTEKGSEEELLVRFGLTESVSTGYEMRTRANIMCSDGTVVFGDLESAGSKLTVRVLKATDKPYITNPTIEELVAFIKDNSISILNVAGNRGSKLTTKQKVEIPHILYRSFKSVIALNKLEE